VPLDILETEIREVITRNRHLFYLLLLFAEDKLESLSHGVRFWLPLFLVKKSRLQEGRERIFLITII